MTTRALNHSMAGAALAASVLVAAGAISLAQPSSPPPSAPPRPAQTSQPPARAGQPGTMDGRRMPPGNPVRMKREDFDRAMTNWPEKPMEQAKLAMDKYGPPSSAGADEAVWYNAGPYRYIRIYSEEATHDFPIHHTDFFEQAVYYRVPTDKAGMLDMFDGSVLIDRTKGLLAARCDKEENNLLALNLANDVLTGSKSVEEARAFYGKAVMAAKQGQKDPYMTGLRFTPMGASAADPDHADSGMTHDGGMPRDDGR